MGRELSREGEVVKSGDAEHRGVNAVALQTAVAKDLPGLHPREDVLDAAPDLAVGGVVLLLPSRQFGLAAFAAVFSSLRNSPGARTHYDRRREAGDDMSLPNATCSTDSWACSPTASNTRSATLSRGLFPISSPRRACRPPLDTQ